MMRANALQRLARLAALRAQQAQQAQLQQSAPTSARSFSALPAAAEPSSAEAPKNSVDGKVMHPSLLNANLLKTQYAVRGELYLKAEELRKQGKEIIFTNGASSLLPFGRLSARTVGGGGAPLSLSRDEKRSRPQIPFSPPPQNQKI